MRPIFAVLWLLLLSAAPAWAQLPGSVQQATREAEAECRSAGGRPNLNPAFRATLDLNGDGQPDYVHDYTALDCQGAPSFFCGSAGCPIVAFVSPAYRAQPLGHSQSWTVIRSGPLPVMVLAVHGSGCGRAGAAGCEQRVAWNGREMARVGSAPPQAPPQAPTASARPAPTPAQPGAKPAAPAADAAPAGAWQTRQGSDGRTVAIAAGPGVVRALTVLCHQGTPLVAVSLRARPPAGPVSLSFAGRAGRAAVALSPASGDTWIADLRGTTLPRLLVGDDPALDLAINGGQQGRLSLQGSTRSVREALAACHAF